MRLDELTTNYYTSDTTLPPIVRAVEQLSVHGPNVQLRTANELGYTDKSGNSIGSSVLARCLIHVDRRVRLSTGCVHSSTDASRRDDRILSRFKSRLRSAGHRRVEAWATVVNKRGAPMP